ncbi:MerC domain-containing protein [Sphingomonas flavalba]|uniref:MerC domain-containing protein n=1 Tax=Sphingomonas flavalba TaxID=2559804 RepID=UPI0039DFB4FD
MLLPGAIGLFAASAAFHYVALALVVPAALAAFWVGYLRHRALPPAVLGCIGAGCLAAALLPGMAEGAETWATVTGSLFLIAGHLLNWRLRRHAA